MWTGVIVASRFRLVRALGKGGMGEVWLAQDQRLDTPCAIKFLRGGELDKGQTRMRFEREAKAAAQLRSPHVVQILDHGEHDGAPYIAMELLDGEDLAHRLQRLGRLTREATLEVVEQVARALTRAHAAGLVHRDLKPANIFLVPDDHRELVKVLDFGIVKTLAVGAPASVRSFDASSRPVSATQTGAIMGTPHYMSPEQATADRQIDTRADLWSLAIVTFQCLTGRLPFVADDFADLVMKILLDPIPRPSDCAPDLPRTVDAWFVRAAAREPGQRFQTARELADALAQALQLTGQPNAPSAQPSAPPAPPSTTPPATMQPATFQPATFQPATVQPATFQPATFQPATMAPATIQPGTMQPWAQTSSADRGEFDPSARPAKKRRHGVIAVIAGAALLLTGLVSAGLWTAKTAPSKSSSRPRASSAPASAAPSAPPSAAPLAPDCSVTRACPDMLHQVCNMAAVPHACVTSTAGARLALSYDGAPAYAGVSSTGAASLDVSSRIAMLRYTLIGAPEDQATTVHVVFMGPIEVGTRSFDETTATPLVQIYEGRSTLGSATYKGTYRWVKGTVTITSIDYRFGGHIRGKVESELIGGADTTKHKGKVSADFYAQFPK